jgi:hypothetical protein
MANNKMTLKELAEASYWWYCKDAFKTMFGFKFLPFNEWLGAVNLLGGFFFWLLCVLLFPVTVPLAGYTRKQHAKKLVEQYRKDYGK